MMATIMISEDSLNCEKVGSAFEGRQAVLIEKGVLLVEVFNICWSVSDRHINIAVQEVP
jgi:hypothetical protein